MMINFADTLLVLFEQTRMTWCYLFRLPRSRCANYYAARRSRALSLTRPSGTELRGQSRADEITGVIKQASAEQRTSTKRMRGHATNTDPLQVCRGLGLASRNLREQQCVAAQGVHVLGIGSKGALIVVLRRRNVALDCLCQRCSCSWTESRWEAQKRNGTGRRDRGSKMGRGPGAGP